MSGVSQGPPPTMDENARVYAGALRRYRADLERHGRALDSGLPGLLSRSADLLEAYIGSAEVERDGSPGAAESELTRLRAELEAERESRRWRACANEPRPRDVMVLVIHDDGHRRIFDVLCYGVPPDDADLAPCSNEAHYTHWQPLPALPVAPVEPA